MSFIVPILILVSCTSLFAGIRKKNPSDVRVATANLTTGRYQNYDDGHGMRIMKASSADIFLVQEFNYKENTEEDIREFTDKVCGKECEFFREEQSEYTIPNGIISRFSILKSGSIADEFMSNRGFAWAKIELPSQKVIHVFSVHLSSKHPGRRVKEMSQLLDEPMDTDGFVIIGGDFNIRGTDEKCFELVEEKFGHQDLAVGVDGKSGTNKSRNKPYDLLIHSKKLDKAEVAIDIRAGDERPLEGVNTFSSGLIFDTRDFYEHDPILNPAKREDSSEAFMQHQLVLRDYRI
jgi:endonuclease/exonuclease/phosphatase family metal-dependent hydrolase